MTKIPIAYDQRIREKIVELKEKGWTTNRIKEATGVSEATQRRYCQRQKKGISLGVTNPDRTLHNNGNSKVTPDNILNYSKNLLSKMTRLSLEKEEMN